MKIWVLFPAWGCYEDTGGRKARALPIWGSLPWGGGAGGAVADGLAGEGCPQQAGYRAFNPPQVGLGDGRGWAGLVFHFCFSRTPSPDTCSGTSLWGPAFLGWHRTLERQDTFSQSLFGYNCGPVEATRCNKLCSLELALPWGFKKAPLCLCPCMCDTPTPGHICAHAYMHTHAQVCTQCSSWEVKKEGVKIEH